MGRGESLLPVGAVCTFPQARQSLPFDVHLPSGDIVERDILFVAKGNLGIVQDWIRGTPDLVVDVLSQDQQRALKGLIPYDGDARELAAFVLENFARLAFDPSTRRYSFD